MFSAYFDASGAKDQNVLAVAGFIAPVDAWISWESAWLTRLQKDGLKRFHYKALNEWEVSKKDALIDDLCSIIHEHVHYKAGVVIVNETIDILTKEERHRWGINPYTLACTNVAKVMGWWTSTWGGRFPELFFEKGDPGQERLDRHFKLIGYPRPNIKRKNNWVNPKTGVEEIGLVPFDSADLFAYQLFARERVFRRDGHITAAFQRIHPMLDKINGPVGTVTPEHLRFLKEGLAKEDTDSLILCPSIKINTS
jgi:hypothetical protein